MALRLTLGLAVLLCLAGMAAAYWPQPHVSEPSKLEKACWMKGIYIPCFIRDEALHQQWSI